jgi:hypothetical protein
MGLFATTMMILGTFTVWNGQSVTAFVLAHMLLIPLSGSLLGQLFAVARLVTADLPRNDRDALLAILRALFAVPFVIVLPLWGQAFQAGLSLLVIYPTTMVVALLQLAVILRFWPADTRAPWREQKSGLGFRASLAEMLRGPVLLRVMLVGAMHSGTAICGVILGLVFAQASGRGTADVGLFFGLFVAIEVVVTLLIGQLLLVLRRLHVIALGVVTYAGFLALMPFLAPTPWIWLLVFPAGAGGAMIYALAIGYLQDLLGARAGAGASLLALQRLSTEGLSATIFAFGAWVHGYDLVALLGALTMMLAIGAILWLDRFSAP